MKNKKRILWLSRHSPTIEQQQSLESILGEPLDLIQVSTTVKSAYEVREIIDKQNCDDIVVILPLNIIAQLCSIGIYPIRPVQSQKEVNGKTITDYNSFVRVENVEVTQRNLTKKVNGTKRRGQEIV